MKQRKICWPFDRVCLQGGCIHCRDHEYHSEESILRAIESKKYNLTEAYIIKYRESYFWGVLNNGNIEWKDES